ncbi:hypothetical protein [Diplocloster modestus]|uniref:HNH homing endonuclease n=1 Tax=Diplocloster modestus TaxID=2850322 RepID=A0ABS6KC46_9FIRM|nr:hypothetical protein [Diplocloster modestus]MBU9728066.1 hypothetical protein [Diplocloster modestus]
MNYIHGKSSTRLHGIWRGMKMRCYNKKSSSYDRYGERGIRVCAEWKDDFKVFYDWSIRNGYDDTKSIDRIDVNGNYSPDNCRWVDEITQANNKRNNNIVIAHGEAHSLSEWSRISGIDRKTLSDRIRKLGWTLEKALEIEPRDTYDHRGNKAKHNHEGGS